MPRSSLFKSSWKLYLQIIVLICLFKVYMNLKTDNDGCSKIINPFIIVASNTSSVGPLQSIIESLHKHPCVLMVKTVSSFIRLTTEQEKVGPRPKTVGFHVQTLDYFDKILKAVRSSSLPRGCCTKIIFLDRHPLFSGLCSVILFFRRYLKLPS